MSNDTKVYLDKEQFIAALKNSNENVFKTTFETVEGLGVNVPMYFQNPEETNSVSASDYNGYNEVPIPPYTPMENIPDNTESNEPNQPNQPEVNLDGLYDEPPMKEEGEEEAPEGLQEEAPEGLQEGEEEGLQEGLQEGPPEVQEGSNLMGQDINNEMNNVTAPGTDMPVQGEETEEKPIIGGRRTRRRMVSFADLFTRKRRYRKKTRRICKNKSRKSSNRRRKTRR